MNAATIREQIKALDDRCPSRTDDPEGYRRNIEERSKLSDKLRTYQSASTGWKVA